MMRCKPQYCDDEMSIDLRAVCLVRAIANEFDDDFDERWSCWLVGRWKDVVDMWMT